MEPRLIYRIEDENGMGPFQDPYAQRHLWHYNGNHSYPSPADDPDLGDRRIRDALKPKGVRFEDMVVGCSSLDRLRYWFDADLCRLFDRLGFSFTIWRCPPDHCIEGRFQTIFDRAGSECIKRDPAVALWDEALQQPSLPLAA